MEVSDATRMVVLLKQLLPTVNDEQLYTWGEVFKRPEHPDPEPVEDAIRRYATEGEKFIGPMLGQFIREAEMEHGGEARAAQRARLAAEEAERKRQAIEDERKNTVGFDRRSFAHMSPEEFAERLGRVKALSPFIAKRCAGVTRESVGVFVAGLIDRDVSANPPRQSAAAFLDLEA